MGSLSGSNYVSYLRSVDKTALRNDFFFFSGRSEKGHMAKKVAITALVCKNNVCLKKAKS